MALWHGTAQPPPPPPWLGKLLYPLMMPPGSAEFLSPLGKAGPRCTAYKGVIITYAVVYCAFGTRAVGIVREGVHLKHVQKVLKGMYRPELQLEGEGTHLPSLEAMVTIDHDALTIGVQLKDKIQ